MDAWGYFEEPCPHCGGVVRFYDYDADCRGNEGSSGIHCSNCNKEFAWEEVRTFKRIYEQGGPP